MNIQDEMIILTNADVAFMDLLHDFVKDGVVTFDVVDRPDKSDPTNNKVMLVPRG